MTIIVYVDLSLCHAFNGLRIVDIMLTKINIHTFVIVVVHLKQG